MVFSVIFAVQLGFGGRGLQDALPWLFHGTLTFMLALGCSVIIMTAHQNRVLLGAVVAFALQGILLKSYATHTLEASGDASQSRLTVILYSVLTLCSLAAAFST